MISLDKATKDWKTDGVWKIAPAGILWIKEGARARIGEGARIGAWATIGEGARIGEGATIGAWATIGEGARIGANSTEAIDLGWADGYRKCIACVDGVAYIGAGCRWFTLDAALKHWGNNPNRVITMCLMAAAVQIAGYKGWKQS